MTLIHHSNTEDGSMKITLDMITIYLVIDYCAAVGALCTCVSLLMQMHLNAEMIHAYTPSHASLPFPVG